ncbi:hypothetical protein [uncultured Parasutterella sp.]|uniref:hypothetical protein n=1 Tax=uncultured Parasutterella sp. TaxID=1263098 RepID=UPI00258AB85B|nr:hypothetical protein [uncultured Parasutterella sp.]
MPWWSWPRCFTRWNFVSKKSAAGSEFVLLYEIFALLIYFPLLFFADFNKLTRLPIEG